MRRSGRRLDTKASNTAEINAAQRASEARRRPEQRIVEDVYARYFLQQPAYRALAAFRPVGLAALKFIDRRYAGLNAIILLRARYAEEAVAELSAAGVDQVVLLGAGYDSTALRHQAPAVTVYEVDSPTTQRAKQRCIARHGLETRQRVAYVPCDFEHDSIVERLAQSEFDRTRPCVVIWFGVSYYLTRDAVARALADLAAISAAGSTLLVDYMDPAIADGSTPHPGARRLAKTVVRRGEPYLSGFADGEMREVLAEAGFGVSEQVRMPDLGRRYGGPGGVWCRTDDLFGIVRAQRTSSP